MLGRQGRCDVFASVSRPHESSTNDSIGECRLSCGAQVIEILYAVGIILALLIIVDKLNRARVDRLRGRGIYPPSGQETEANVERLLMMGRKIDAIKVYRAVHGVGLKEAKQAVDELVRRHDVGRSRD